MNLLIVLVGLPRAGKTTWALEHILPVVSPDAIRQVLLASNTPVVPQAMVDHMASFQIRSLFMAGHTRVILDDCNVKREDRDRWHPKAKEPTWEVVFHHVYTGKDACIERAIVEHIPVIEAMEDEFEPLEADENIYDANHFNVPKEVLEKLLGV